MQRDATLPAARRLVAPVLLVSRTGNVLHPGPASAYLQAARVPCNLWRPAAVSEIVAVTFFVSDFANSLVSPVPAEWDIGTAKLFHSGLSDQLQRLSLLAALGMALGFLALSITGTGMLSSYERCAT